MHLGINKKSLTFFKFCDVSLKKGLMFFKKGLGLFFFRQRSFFKRQSLFFFSSGRFVTFQSILFVKHTICSAQHAKFRTTIQRIARLLLLDRQG